MIVGLSKTGSNARDVVAGIGRVAGENLTGQAGAVHNRELSAVPFKHQAEHRHHIPRPRYRVTNQPEYDAALRRRGSLTVWFTDAAIAAWRAEPRTTPGGQPHFSPLAITTALTMRMVFGLALRQTEGLIGSLVALLGLALAVPDHSTLSRRSKTLEVPPHRRLGAGPLHLLVDSTGLKLGGAGEWLVEKHGTSRCRSWRKLHIGIDGESGEIVAIELTKKESDDGGRTAALLDQLTDPLASFTADGAYDQDRVYETVAERHPDAAVIVPPRATGVPGPSATTAPTQRDRHIQEIVAHGRMGWQKSSGYNLRAKVEAVIGRSFPARTTEGLLDFLNARMRDAAPAAGTPPRKKAIDGTTSLSPIQRTAGGSRSGLWDAHSMTSKAGPTGNQQGSGEGHRVPRLRQA